VSDVGCVGKRLGFGTGVAAFVVPLILRRVETSPIHHRRRHHPHPYLFQ
jgi:hypothetical protein